MKFRRTCTVCGTTFFSPDRKAAYCLKCVKKKIVKHVPSQPKPVAVTTTQPRMSAQPVRAVPRPAPSSAQRSAVAPRKQKIPRPPRVEDLTPELRSKILEIYQTEFANNDNPLREVNSQIATKLWIKRKLVADVLQPVTTTVVEITPELRNKAIDLYKRFVETGYRPQGGRRHAISVTLGVPYKQVMKMIRDWARTEYEKSPTPEPSREQLFEIEKLYWSEMDQQRFRLMELPEKMAEQLGYVTRWQVLRWLDILHDDERAFNNVPDPSPEVQQQILDAYREYLASPTPPEQGLHFTIAGTVGGITPRQVHKVLQTYRHKRRVEYPLL